jgi:hypothetical protein
LFTQFTPKIKLITFLNELGKISPLKFEGQFAQTKRNGTERNGTERNGTERKVSG